MDDILFIARRERFFSRYNRWNHWSSTITCESAPINAEKSRALRSVIIGLDLLSEFIIRFITSVPTVHFYAAISWNPQEMDRQRFF